MKIKHENNPSSENGVVASRQVQVPHSYFRKAKSEYADWRWAMIREFIQNSYDAQATTIDFRLAVNDRDAIELSVDDDGIGIPADERQRVFTAFTRLDRSRDRATGGHGLGLAIVSLVMEQHGGSAFADESPIGGARFTLSWPMLQSVTQS